MTGWYNPLPIGQSVPNSSGTQHLGSYRKKVNPVAGPVPGHSSTTTPGLSLRLSSPTPPQPQFTILSTPRIPYLSCSSFLAFSISRVLHSPPALPALIRLCAPIAISGNIGGNNLPGQGQRHPQQRFRQWN